MNTITTDTPTMKDFYLSHFATAEKDFLFDVRKVAINRFAEIGFPTKKNEDWKYTDISPLLKTEYALETSSLQIKNTNTKNIVVENLRDGIKQHKEIFEKYFSPQHFQNDAFALLNTAFAKDGIFAVIPENTNVEEPVEIEKEGGAKDNTIFYSRNIIVVRKNSKLTLIEKFISPTPLERDGVRHSFNNTVTEIILHENASVDYYKIANENKNSYHIGSTRVHQEKGSKFSSNTITLSGAIVRNNLTITLTDEHCEAILNGLYLVKGTQLVDNHTFVDHAKPNCYSNELYKGVISDKATAVFNGKVMVRKDAQKTNAFQSNKNILLSDEASVNSKPQLEIFADDVKCSHGATTGQMDKEALFYLQARGIDKETAKALLVQAFANEIIEKIKVDSLKEYLQGIIQK